MLRELGVRPDMFDEALALGISDWDDGKEIRASDFIPTPTDPHAKRELVTVKELEHVEEQLDRE